MLLYYLLPPDMQRVYKGTTYLLGELICHEGVGSLYYHLKSNGFIEKIRVDDDLRYRQVCLAYSIELRLTEEGLN